MGNPATGYKLSVNTHILPFLMQTCISCRAVSPHPTHIHGHWHIVPMGPPHPMCTHSRVHTHTHTHTMHALAQSPPVGRDMETILFLHLTLPTDFAPLGQSLTCLFNRFNYSRLLRPSNLILIALRCQIIWE
jgi:hypothetical protein